MVKIEAISPSKQRAEHYCYYCCREKPKEMGECVKECESSWGDGFTHTVSPEDTPTNKQPQQQSDDLVLPVEDEASIRNRTLQLSTRRVADENTSRPPPTAISWSVQPGGRACDAAGSLVPTAMPGPTARRAEDITTTTNGSRGRDLHAADMKGDNRCWIHTTTRRKAHEEKVIKLLLKLCNFYLLLFSFCLKLFCFFNSLQDTIFKKLV